jgi:hypothetical protein
MSRIDPFRGSEPRTRSSTPAIDTTIRKPDASSIALRATKNPLLVTLHIAFQECDPALAFEELVKRADSYLATLPVPPPVRFQGGQCIYRLTVMHRDLHQRAARKSDVARACTMILPHRRARVCSRPQLPGKRHRNAPGVYRRAVCGEW